MSKRLFSFLIAVPTLILMLGAFPVPLLEANAQTPSAPDVHVQTVPTGTAIIWCSLFAGSNFNFNTGCAHIGDNHSHVHIVHVHTHTTHVVQVTPTSTMSTEQMPTTVNDNDADDNGGTSAQSTTSSSASTSSSTVTTTQPTDTQDQGQEQDQQQTSSSSSVPTGTQIIWCGLWNGSNFNITDSCANIGNDPPASQSQPAPSTQMQSQPATTATPAPTVQTTAASDPPANQGTYAALGDSVAAGLGLPLAANADASATACGRSPQGYPNLVAARMHLTLNDIACSNTTVGDLVTPETVNGSSQSPQLDQAFAGGTPKFMSITSGANDAEWSFFLAQCYNGNCATVANTASVDALLVALQAKLHVALSSIQSRSHGTPPITAVTGYYQPVSMRCMQASGGKLTSSDVTWIQSATSALNQTIMQTAQQYSFVRFVPINFTGHDVCSSNPWLQTPSDPAPFHPTAQGQSMIANEIEAAFAK